MLKNIKVSKKLLALLCIAALVLVTIIGVAFSVLAENAGKTKGETSESISKIELVSEDYSSATQGANPGHFKNSRRDFVPLTAEDGGLSEAAAAAGYGRCMRYRTWYYGEGAIYLGYTSFDIVINTPVK